MNIFIVKKNDTTISIKKTVFKSFKKGFLFFPFCDFFQKNKIENRKGELFTCCAAVGGIEAEGFSSLSKTSGDFSAIPTPDRSSTRKKGAPLKFWRFPATGGNGFQHR
ncbi:hypothetical protein V6Z11_A10G262700 [Gossypium hirsutum]